MVMNCVSTEVSYYKVQIYGALRTRAGGALAIIAAVLCDCWQQTDKHEQMAAADTGSQTKKTEKSRKHALKMACIWMNS